MRSRLRVANAEVGILSVSEDDRPGSLDREAGEGTPLPQARAQRQTTQEGFQQFQNRLSAHVPRFLQRAKPGASDRLATVGRSPSRWRFGAPLPPNRLRRARNDAHE